MSWRIVIELMGGPMDGCVRSMPDEEPDLLLIPFVCSKGPISWPYVRTERVNQDGRIVYEFARYHPLTWR